MNASVKVKVLVSATYARANLVDVVHAKKGQLIDICSGWYVDKMVNLGNVRMATDEDVDLIEKEEILESDDVFGEDDQVEDDDEDVAPVVVTPRGRGRPPRNG